MVRRLFALLLFVPSLMAIDRFTLVTEEWPPYSSNTGPTPSGSDIEVLNAVAADLGIAFDYRFLPWSRAVEMARSGLVDGIFSLYDTPERRDFLTYPKNHLGIETLVLVARNEDSWPYRKIQDLAGLSIGVLLDNNNGKDFDSSTLFQRVVAPDTEKGLRMLDAGRMRALVINKANFLEWVKDNAEFQGRFRLTPLVVNRENLFLAFSLPALKNKAIPVAKIDASLGKLRANGTIKAIEEKYFGSAGGP